MLDNNKKRRKKKATKRFNIAKLLGVMLKQSGGLEDTNVLLLEKVRDILSEFNPNKCVIFEQRFIQGLSCDEIANLKGVAPQTIWRITDELITFNIPRILADLATIKIGRYYVRMSATYKDWIVCKKNELIIGRFELKEDAIEHARIMEIKKQRKYEL